MNIKEKIKQFKEQRSLLVEAQKKLVVDAINRKWTADEVELYNMQYNIPAVPYGYIFMNEQQIKLNYLRFNKSLFTNEEVAELLDVIFNTNLKEAKRTK
jgi:hypothetical protein